MTKIKKTKEQTIQWPKEKDQRTDNAMTKRKKTKGQTMQWPKEKD